MDLFGTGKETKLNFNVGKKLNKMTEKELLKLLIILYFDKNFSKAGETVEDLFDIAKGDV